MYTGVPKENWNLHQKNLEEALENVQGHQHNYEVSIHVRHSAADGYYLESRLIHKKTGDLKKTIKTPFNPGDVKHE